MKSNWVREMSASSKDSALFPDSTNRCLDFGDLTCADSLRPDSHVPGTWYHAIGQH